MITTTHPPAQRAVVIGASIAGLLAARVLAERFAEVLLLERDELPEGPALRKGTPHALHAHALLARGRQAIESLFPGFTQALAAQGALVGDIGQTAGVESASGRFARRPAGELGLCASRPAIEAEIRRRVRALPGVRILTGMDVLEPVYDAGAGRVTGLRAAPVGEPGRPQTLDAALVVDCSGRGSRTPQWLQAWGLAAPAEERVTVGLAYATAYFERDPARTGELRVIVCTASPQRPRPGVVLAQEPDAAGRARWVMTVGGYAGDHAEATPDGLRRRAHEIGAPEMLELVDRGRRIGPVTRYLFSHSQRRRYERLKRFPAGYLVLGDALTSFNPIYGQGMTVAACEALALRNALARGLDGVHRHVFKAAARVIDNPWQLAVGADLALPSVPGPRPLPVRLVNAYIARLFRAAVHDAHVAGAFSKVMHLLAPPSSLFAPGVLWRVLRRGALPRPHGSARPALPPEVGSASRS